MRTVEPETGFRLKLIKSVMKRTKTDAAGQTATPPKEA